MRPMGIDYVALSKPVWMVAADLIAGSSKSDCWQHLPHAYGMACANAIPAMLLLYAKSHGWYSFVLVGIYDVGSGFLWVLSLFPCPCQHGDTRTKGYINLCLGKSPVQGYSWNFCYKADGKRPIALWVGTLSTRMSCPLREFHQPIPFFCFGMCFVSILSVLINHNFQIQRVKAGWPAG